MQHAVLILLSAAGSLWGVLLVVGGALLPSILGCAWPGAGPSATLLGLTVIAAGEYVFLTVVADRLFPRASRRVVAGGELLLGGLMVSLGASAAASLLIGGAAA